MRFAAILGWRRLRVMAVTALLISLIMLPTWEAPYRVLIGRLLLAGALVLIVFGVLERWPARLPRWLARWVLQIVGVAIAVPLAVMVAYFVTTIGDEPAWFRQESRLLGFGMMSMIGLLLAPWIAMVSLLRKISGEAERQALASRLQLLQSQVEPHFLFNTLANVRELVDTGSPRASTVLNSLIAYLRAAVPRLNEAVGTLGQELELARAYLEVMQMRMPDRLQFTLYADPDALELACPRTALLTLVENAVRHGIDPAEEGGRIEVRVLVRDGRCRVQVVDTGAGLGHPQPEWGTGLTNLRERMLLAFEGDAQLRLSPLEPRGTCAELEFPARKVQA